MIIKTARFICSNTDHTKAPPADKPEYAFIGRSNVGKSSLINMLVNQKGLAKTSGRPGKTQLINHFLVNESWYLVDLPGYGYAKVSRTERQKWQAFITNYLLQRKNLLCIFVLIDMRLEPQQIDLDFMEWLGEKELPFVIVFTKSDKLTKLQLINNTKAYTERLLQSWEELPTIHVTSATERKGAEEILTFIGETNSLINGKANPPKNN